MDYIYMNIERKMYGIAEAKNRHKLNFQVRALDEIAWKFNSKTPQ